MERTKKMYVVIPESLYFELKNHGVITDFDNIVTELLAEKIELLRIDERDGLTIFREEKLRKIRNVYNLSEKWIEDKEKQIRATLKTPGEATEEEIEIFVINAIERRALSVFMNKKKHVKEMVDKYEKDHGITGDKQ